MVIGGSVEHYMKCRGQGQYAISYQPTVKGKHQLHIKADGQHISRKPIQCYCKVASGENLHSNPHMA